MAKAFAAADATKVVHLPADLGMRAYSLSQVERASGLESYMIVRSRGVHNSDWVEPLYSSNPIVYGWRLLRAFLKSSKADVIMANAGTSLIDFPRLHLELMDVALYRLLGKRLIVTYQGCDIRLCESCPIRASLEAQALSETCVNVPLGFTYRKFDRLKLKRFKVWSRYADVILGITPDLCLMEGIVYSPHAKLLDALELKATKNEDQGDSKVRIAHMPKKHVKGSEWIEQQLETLCVNFPNEVEYVPIEGLAWKDCLKVLSSCDILIDQVLQGWYGGISVEAALLGVFPIAYVNPDFLRFVPDNMRNDLPVLALEDKVDLLHVLEQLISCRDGILQEAARCRQSALKFHEAKAVAQRIIEQYYIYDL